MTYQRQPSKAGSAVCPRCTQTLISPWLTSQIPALVLSSFHLSTIPSTSAQRTHIQHLLSLSSPYLIIVDRNTAAGWEAMSSAREYILGLSTPESPLHIVAPCPHEAACPMLGGRESCSFSQRLQRPTFVRRTKHAKKGEEDMGYSYLVIARGERPGRSQASSSTGRVGGVAREEGRRLREKTEGRTVLREVEGGGFEMVSLVESMVEGGAIGSAEDALEMPEEEVDLEGLRTEAYEWPRLIAPPIKRSGHVIMDTCHPTGELTL